MMDLVTLSVVAGLLGTLAMDGLNLLFARAGIISRIDVGMIGRMAVGWTRGRFRYWHPTEMETAEHELICGVATHYGIGVALAIPYVVGWTLLFGGPASPAGAIIYGMATTVASWFFVYPSLGFGVLGMGSPDGLRAPLSALANHLFYGMGLGAGITLINPVLFSV